MFRKIKFTPVLIGLLGISRLNGSVAIPAAAQSKPIVLKHATIHPVTSEVIRDGMLLFDDGQIVALGETVTIPADAEIVDIKGRQVYPGLIEAWSQLGLTEISAVKSTRDLNELGPMNPNVRAEIAVNPESDLIPVARANGIAMAVIKPEGGLISGQSALLMLDGWTWEEMTLKSPVSLIIHWPRMHVNPSPWIKETDEEQKKQIHQHLEQLDDIFRKAKAYMKARTAADGSSDFQKTDLRLKALLPVLRRDLPVWIHANSLLQIEVAIGWTDKQQIRMVLVGGRDAPLAADLLKSRNIPVVVTPVFRLPGSRDAAFDEPFTLPLHLHRSGIPFCISGGGAGNVRNLPYHAAKAAAHGLPGEEALKSVTLYPAQIIGVADRVGSLEAGKDATFIITDGDPLEVMTQVETLYIQGKKIDLNNRHLSLYKKYLKRYLQIHGND